MLPSTMIAIEVDGAVGPAEALKMTRIPVPQPSPGQILIETRAAGVNRPDVIQRLGYYPPPKDASSTLGLEVAGEVAVAAGRWKVGDRVCALLGGGGYAGYAVCDARHALPIPARLGFSEAAGLPETVFTVYVNLFEHGALKAGETLLVHGANSGIGTIAIQMAKAAGARVIATARGADKAAFAARIGADIAVDTESRDFADAAATDGVDVILDMVAGPYFAKNIDALTYGGRLVHIAFSAGERVELPLMQVMVKQLVITGSTLRSRTADEKARIAAAVEAMVWPWIVSGQVTPIIDRTLPISQAAEAHSRLEAGKVLGKIILELPESRS